MNKTFVFMTAEELYYELNRIWSSPHNDSPEEMRGAISDLVAAMGRRVKPEDMIKKMKQKVFATRDENPNYKPRLSLEIKNRFWEKQYVQMIDYRPFKYEDY